MQSVKNNLFNKQKAMHLPPAVTSFLLCHLYSSISATLRISEYGREAVDELNAKGQRMIFCLWHDELFSLIPIARQLRIAAVVSPSRDGDMLARILASKNVEAVRGSSTRGGMRALVALAHVMQKSLIHACITLDGPAGPRHKAKDGALFLASRTRAHIVPVRIFCHNALRCPTWDRFQVPLPFSRASILIGRPWEADAVLDIEEPGISAARLRLEKDLEALGSSFAGEK